MIIYRIAVLHYLKSLSCLIAVILLTLFSIEHHKHNHRFITICCKISLIFSQSIKGSAYNGHHSLTLCVSKISWSNYMSNTIFMLLWVQYLQGILSPSEIFLPMVLQYKMKENIFLTIFKFERYFGPVLLNIIASFWNFIFIGLVN